MIAPDATVMNEPEEYIIPLLHHPKVALDERQNTVCSGKIPAGFSRV
jgi:hypothetical protein